MKIDRVTVKYGELRSSGYPNFSNTRHELELSATLEPGETANEARAALSALAKNAVKKEFGDKVINADQMDIPF